MATVANLKLLFGADTSGLEKGAKTAKESVKDFDKTVQGATDSIAGMFGVDTAAIEKMTSSLRGLGENLKTSANTGIASFGKMLTSINGATAAIAGLGIGSAVAAFKLLNAEAENFKNTVAGANLEMATATYISTYTQALHDMNAETGKTVAEFEEEFKRAMARIGANIKSSIVGNLTGNRSIVSNLLGPLGMLVGGTTSGQRQDAAARAETAAAAQEKILALTLQISEKEIEWMRAEAQISDLKLKVRDTSLSITERQRIQADLIQKINERFGEEYDLRKKIADAQATISEQAADDLAANEKKNQLAAQAERVQLNLNNALREAAESGRAIATEAAKEADARRKSLDAVSGQADRMADMIIGKSIMGETNLSISGTNSLAAAAQEASKALAKKPIELVYKPVLREEDIKDMTDQLKSLTSSAIESVSDSIGGLIGDLVTGGDAMDNFKNSMLSGFADMAIAVGKIAIAEGVAVTGIKAALESLNPAIAIGAGAALVALGTAVKAGLSNVASGNYSAGSTALSTAGASVGATGYSQSSLKIEVTGRLRASGSDLITVIDRENNRRNQTT